MLYVDLAALAMLVYFFFRGFRRGFIISVLGIAGLICAYLGAYLFFRPLGDRIQVQFALSPMIAYLLGGLAAFVGIYFCFGIIIGIVSWKRRTREKKAEAQTPWLDKWLGGILGVGLGFVLVAIIIWLYALAQFSPVGKKLPDISASVSAQASAAVIRNGAYVIIRNVTESPEMSQAIAKSVSNPGAAAADLQRLWNHPQLKVLVKDQEFLGAVLKGDEKLVLENPEFNRTFADPDLIENARDLGLMPQETDLNAYKKATAAKLAAVGQNFDKIRNDPEVQEILHDPEISAMIEKEDIRGLLADDRFHRLVGRVFAVIGTGDEEKKDSNTKDQKVVPPEK